MGLVYSEGAVGVSRDSLRLRSGQASLRYAAGNRVWFGIAQNDRAGSSFDPDGQAGPSAALRTGSDWRRARRTGGDRAQDRPLKSAASEPRAAHHACGRQDSLRGDVSRTSQRSAGRSHSSRQDGDHASISLPSPTNRDGRSVGLREGGAQISGIIHVPVAADHERLQAKQPESQPVALVDGGGEARGEVEGDGAGADGAEGGA